MKTTYLLLVIVFIAGFSVCKMSSKDYGSELEFKHEIPIVKDSVIIEALYQKFIKENRKNFYLYSLADVTENDSTVTAKFRWYKAFTICKISVYEARNGEKGRKILEEGCYPVGGEAPIFVTIMKDKNRRNVFDIKK